MDEEIWRKKSIYGFGCNVVKRFCMRLFFFVMCILVLSGGGVFEKTSKDLNSFHFPYILRFWERGGRGEGERDRTGAKWR